VIEPPASTGRAPVFAFQRRRLSLLFLIVFCNFLGATIVLPTLPLFAQRHFNAPPETISLLLASFFIAQFLAAPLLGRASDRFGRLPVLLVSQIGTCLSFVMLAGATSLAMLFAARILDGITGGNVIVAQAYVTDITPRKERTRGLGLIFAAFGLGYIVGPGVGGLIGSAFGDTAPFWAGAAVSLLTVVLTWLFLDESLPADERRRRAHSPIHLNPRVVLGSSALLLILITGFAAQFSIAVMQATITLYGDHVLFVGQDERAVNLGIGLMLTGFGVGQFITQLVLIRPLVTYFGERRLVVIGAFFRAIGMLSIAAFTSPVLVGGFSLMLVAIASGVMMPSLQALATTSVSEEVSGGVLGVYNAAVSLGIIAGTYAGGHLFAITPQMPFIAAGLVLLATLIPAGLLLGRARPVSEIVPAIGD
jgi:DHA1 family tetracycline resistance protein-like MFS transporter